MNDLQQARKLLEDKINLTNSLIARKKKDFDYHSKEADEIQLAIEALIVEKWKDQESLKAVNEEISQIPTLSRNLIALAFLFVPFFSFSQDTIHARKVKIAEHVGISMKTGKVLYAHPRWRKVNGGFFIKKSNDLYIINGKEYHPGNHKPLKIKK